MREETAQVIDQFQHVLIRYLPGQIEFRRDCELYPWMVLGSSKILIEIFWGR